MSNNGDILYRINCKICGKFTCATFSPPPPDFLVICQNCKDNLDKKSNYPKRRR